MQRDGNKRLSKIALPTSVKRKGTVFDTASDTHLSLRQILGGLDNFSLRKTKIVCTLGPQSSKAEILSAMIDNGMNIARFNLSYDSYENLKKTNRTLHDVLANEFDKEMCPVWIDTIGPSTGKLKDGKPLNIKKGDIIEITTDDKILAQEGKLSCSIPNLPSLVSVGKEIFLSNSSLKGKVTEVLSNGIKFQAQNDFMFGDFRDILIPGVKINLSTITPRDYEIVGEFIRNYSALIVGVSFCKCANDIIEMKKFAKAINPAVKVIAKIEDLEGLKNFESILDVADGIMISRGNLGAEIPIEKIFMVQKWMTRIANTKGIPITVATEMLESMIKNPRPTRAEASDVANAVVEGADSVMLIHETTIGTFAGEAVRIMSDICSEAELAINYKQKFEKTEKKIFRRHLNLDDREALAATCVQLSFSLKCPLIICFTERGLVARLISRYRPEATIFAVGDNEEMLESLSIYRGVYSIKLPESKGHEENIRYALAKAKEWEYIVQGQKALVITGRKEGDPSSFNFIRIMQIL